MFLSPGSLSQPGKFFDSLAWITLYDSIVLTTLPVQTCPSRTYDDEQNFFPALKSNIGDLVRVKLTLLCEC